MIRLSRNPEAAEEISEGAADDLTVDAHPAPLISARNVSKTYRTGEVTVDAQGYPEGEVTVKARNWRDILRMAVASGTLPDAFAGTLEDGLGLISQMSGNPKTLDIPLNFRNGKVRLGPVPLGDAPVLRLR